MKMSGLEISGGRFPVQQFDHDVCLLESFSYPCRVSSAVKNSIDPYLILLDTIIDGKGEPLGKKTVVSPKMDAMYSCKQPKRLDIRKEGSQKITTYARFL